MKKVEDVKINENGSYTKKKVTTIDKSDGWVNADTFNHQRKQKHHKNYFKGYYKHVEYETNDPKITRPFVKLMSILFSLIGIAFIIIGIYGYKLMLLFGVIWLITTVWFYISNMQQIKQIEKELEKRNNHN